MVSKRADERSKAIMKTAVATKNLENPKLKKRKIKKKKAKWPPIVPREISKEGHDKTKHVGSNGGHFPVLNPTRKKAHILFLSLEAKTP